MRKLTFSVIAASLALGVAAPASAQYYQVPQYRYQPYNYNHQYNGYAFANSMLGRVQQLRGEIRNMAARRIISPSEFRGLDRESRSVERRIFTASRHGINAREARSVERRIQRLEHRMMKEATDWNGRYGHRRR